MGREFYLIKTRAVWFEGPQMAPEEPDFEEAC